MDIYYYNVLYYLKYMLFRSSLTNFILKLIGLLFMWEIYMV
jgi:hypothetical protein